VEEVTPDGVFESAPAGIPAETKAPPTPARAAVTAPLACPVSLRRLDDRGFATQSGLQYEKRDGVWDLTVGAAVNTAAKNSGPKSLTDMARSLLPKELRGIFPESSYLGTSTFETPQVAFAYERGWRDSFRRAGFPGAEEEFSLAQEKLLPFAQNKVLLDASCGSGLFTRRFVKSKAYGCVVALDFSDAMLQQARTFARDEGLLAAEDEGASSASSKNDALLFVRADIARVPFPEGTVGGVHAGAAIHCWPDPRLAVAEIARVLEPGGAYCGTTFLSPRVPFADEKTQQTIDAALREVRDFVSGPGGPRGFRQWNVKDLEDLCVECGLVDFKADVREPGFVFYSARKPGAWSDE
jgi:ubiquinone/menaquinone biosynthesis C-methylase UbiE